MPPKRQKQKDSTYKLPSNLRFVHQDSSDQDQQIRRPKLTPLRRTTQSEILKDNQTQSQSGQAKRSEWRNAFGSNTGWESESTQARRIRPQAASASTYSNRPSLLKQYSDATNPSVSTSRSQQLPTPPPVNANPTRPTSPSTPPSSSTLWNRQSQIGTQSRVMRQFKRHFGDDENVFYEQTTLMKHNDFINKTWKLLLFLFVVNALLFTLLRSIDPYEGQCPKHAQCGAYVWCNEGYVLNRKLRVCEIDSRVKESGYAIMSGIIEDMKYEWGNRQCTIPPNLSQSQLQQHLEPPKKSLNQIFKQMDIMSQDYTLMRTVLTNYFHNEDIQKIDKFEIGIFGKIYPLEKYYSSACLVNLFYKKNFVGFVGVCLFFVLIVIISLFLLYKKLYTRKAHQIYDFLKEKATQKKTIIFEHYRRQIEQRFNSGRRVTPELWMLVNQFRLKERQVGAYESGEGEGEEIVWRVLGVVGQRGNE